MASQSSPVSGIITAIIAGLIGAIFGGGNYNIIGPTGALSGVIAGFALINGADMVPALTLMQVLLFLPDTSFRLKSIWFLYHQV